MILSSSSTSHSVRGRPSVSVTDAGRGGRRPPRPPPGRAPREALPEVFNVHVTLLVPVGSVVSLLPIARPPGDFVPAAGLAASLSIPHLPPADGAARAPHSLCRSSFSSFSPDGARRPPTPTAPQLLRLRRTAPRRASSAVLLPRPPSLRGTARPHFGLASLEYEQVQLADRVGGAGARGTGPLLPPGDCAPAGGVRPGTTRTASALPDPHDVYHAAASRRIFFFVSTGRFQESSQRPVFASATARAPDVGVPEYVDWQSLVELGERSFPGSYFSPKSDNIDRHDKIVFGALDLPIEGRF